jgi:hypothetical protein
MSIAENFALLYRLFTNTSHRAWQNWIAPSVFLKTKRTVLTCYFSSCTLIGIMKYTIRSMAMMTCHNWRHSFDSTNVNYLAMKSSKKWCRIIVENWWASFVSSDVVDTFFRDQAEPGFLKNVFEELRAETRVSRTTLLLVYAFGKNTIELRQSLMFDENKPIKAVMLFLFSNISSTGKCRYS